MKMLMASDFDGTYRTTRKQLDKNNRAIEKWRAAGNYFGIVTGRGEDFLPKAKEMGLSFDYLIVYNGSLILRPDGSHIHEEFIMRDMFVKLEEYFAPVSDCVYYSKADESEKYFHYYAEMPNPQRALELAEDINGKYGDTITAFVNGPHINIGVKGSGKAEGVGHILEYFGLKKENAVVVGDDYNDLEMISRFNGWSVINGRRAVKKAASHICLNIASLVKILLKKQKKNTTRKDISHE